MDARDRNIALADPVWFWQRIVSPHMAGLATALALTGRKVTYVAETPMSSDRAALGWEQPVLGEVELRLADNPASVEHAVRESPVNSIHILQGFRGNGMVGLARKEVSKRGLRQWIIMETVDDSGWRGMLKRMEYGRIIRAQHHGIEGVLSIGRTTASWLVGLGLPKTMAYPFAYFLPNEKEVKAIHSGGRFRFLFVGRLVELKRVGMLLEALAGLKGEFEVTVVGTGPLEAKLRNLAEKVLPDRVNWVGSKPASHIPALMADSDCLILPSRHDGWGAVVSEALLNGTPAICSDGCGAAGAVRASGSGDVFPANDVKALTLCLARALRHGRPMPAARQRLASWARSTLGADAGADYLEAILRHSEGSGTRPIAPWEDDHPV